MLPSPPSPRQRIRKAHAHNAPLFRPQAKPSFESRAEEHADAAEEDSLSATAATVPVPTWESVQLKLQKLEQQVPPVRW